MSTVPRGRRLRRYIPTQVPNKLDDSFIAWVGREFRSISDSNVASDYYIKQGDDLMLLSSGDASSGDVATANGSGGIAWTDLTELYQPLDSDLTAISEFGSSDLGLLKRTAPAEYVFVPPSDFATDEQGALADSAVQPGDELTVLSSGAALTGQAPLANGAGGIVWSTPTGGGGGGVGSIPAMPFYLTSGSSSPIPSWVVVVGGAIDHYELPFYLSSGDQSNITLVAV